MSALVSMAARELSPQRLAAYLSATAAFAFGNCPGNSGPNKIQAFRRGRNGLASPQAAKWCEVVHSVLQKWLVCERGPMPAPVRVRNKKPRAGGAA
jgi:hypothetical protein